MQRACQHPLPPKETPRSLLKPPQGLPSFILFPSPYSSQDRICQKFSWPVTIWGMPFKMTSCLSKDLIPSLSQL